MRLNLLLAAFNLIPLPPLDGSRIMTWMLPPGLREPYMRLESMGLLLVVLVVFFVPGVRLMMLETIWLAHDLIAQALNIGGAG